ncbi:proline dehydrogenase [Arachnomyces sp. PD_36]|nr:proline dehydrogenase [Arachnomyces sp. PD_36]
MLRTLNLQRNLLRQFSQPRIIPSAPRPSYSLGVRYIHNGTSQPPLTRPQQPIEAPNPTLQTHPLSILPLSTVVRSLFVTRVSSTPYLLKPSLAALSYLSEAKSPFLDPDQNSGLKYVLSKTIYSQFCGGETPEEVKQSVQDLKDLGYSGVILGYAREAVMGDEEAAEISSSAELDTVSGSEYDKQLSAWRDGTLQTVGIAGEGDFVNVKFTGAGEQTLKHLLKGIPPAPSLQRAIDDICQAAKDRGVRLLIDAEQQAIQSSIDAWSLDLQSRYNRREEGHAVVYGTYQAYLRSTPETLARHLATAREKGFILGVKLVRGAYLGSDPRHLMWEHKTETDATYDGIAESLIRRKYGNILRPHQENPSSNQFPEINLVLATHNRASVKRARAIRNEQVHNGDSMINMAYGQLLGMADDISCDLVHEGRTNRDGLLMDVNREIPRAYKALVWGTVGECTKYLLRRAQENQDAASRTEDTRKAMASELGRRFLQSTVS